MIAGIMQPYFMPYLHYFNLIKTVDKFVILDDVNYIKKGWINRNQILINNQAYLFTIPILDLSQNKKIYDLNLSSDPKWKSKFLRTMHQSYSNSPEFYNFFPLLEEIIYFPDSNLSSFIHNSIIKICKFLNIETEIIKSSKIFNSRMTGEHRIIDLCQKLNCSEYLNLPGGRNLYSSETFEKGNIRLNFLNTSPSLKYKQFNDKFIDNLSIIDCLMFNRPQNLQQFFQSTSYE